MSDVEELQSKLHDLTQEHRDLDDAIAALIEKGSFDQLQIQRLKKRKLQLRDMMTRLESLLYPDIIA